jgi:hypothetical protein
LASNFSNFSSLVVLPLEASIAVSFWSALGK